MRGAAGAGGVSPSSVWVTREGRSLGASGSLLKREGTGGHYFPGLSASPKPPNCKDPKVRTTLLLLPQDPCSHLLSAFILPYSLTSLPSTQFKASNSFCLPQSPSCLPHQVCKALGAPASCSLPPSCSVQHPPSAPTCSSGEEL